MLELTPLQVLELCQKNGYLPTDRMRMLFASTPTKDGKLLGTGEHLLAEMELDRVELFEKFFKNIEQARASLDLAHWEVERGAFKNTIEYLQMISQENANTKEGGDDHSGQSQA